MGKLAQISIMEMSIFLEKSLAFTEMLHFFFYLII